MRSAELVIRPAAGLRWADLGDVLSHVGLLYGLAKRQLKTEYGNMYLGFAWAMVRPLAMMVVFSTLKSLAKVETAVNIPYLAYLYSGLILWFFFTESVIDASASLERQGFLVTAIRPPTVPAGTARLRITFTAAHREADVARLADAVRPFVR